MNPPRMKWLDRLERLFGSWTITQFPLFIVAATGTVYLLSFIQPQLSGRLELYPAAVFAGEWWRVFTFLFVPPAMGPFWMVFWLFLVYQIAQALETEWGEFKFCFFYFVGALAMVLASLFIAEAPLSNMPLHTTLFLAFATLFPEFEVLLFFIIPVKVKYLAWISWAFVVWGLLTGSAVTRIGLTASLFNYFLFFGPMVLESAKLRWEVWRNRSRFRE